MSLLEKVKGKKACNGSYNPRLAMSHMQSLRVVSLITRPPSHLDVKYDYGVLLSLLDVTWPKPWRPDPYLRPFNQAESSTEGRASTL